ncbi:Transducin family protein / WD-40 repeat family protein [Melia azedarach]|uniref:Transducin family protein / WD-40 repeat family protein n=1 Tax=Melia azedarach TaxID=155640 RepID=A0ACC1YIJ5_MELAZ|nr:Transducin family protein / WD-40 repeat family protein [Melia azedarach]
MRASIWGDDADAPSSSSSLSRFPPQAATTDRNSGISNVFSLLKQREVSPRTKHSSKRPCREAATKGFDSFRPMFETPQDARRGLLSWVEAESLQHLKPKYCPLSPPPRSTIAAAFSSDGKTLASTHGDHTVKIIDCETGSCLKVLRGHRRTPWVVRFHPLIPTLIASGSLDHEVRLWDANSGECIGSRDFYRPIASIAFHANGELLAVASGHKLYIWRYNSRGETSSPRIVLKTRRSLRAVHFHPHAAPFLLTAEVNDLDSSESSMTIATSPGYSRYPPPAIYMAGAHSSGRPGLAEEIPLSSLPLLVWPSFVRDNERLSLQHINGVSGASRTQQRVGASSSVRLMTYSTPSGQYELVLSPIESDSSSSMPEGTGTDSFVSEVNSALPQAAMSTEENMYVQPEERSNYLFPFGDPTHWELPFLQGWLVGQSQAAQCTTGLLNGSAHENLIRSGESENLPTASVISSSVGQSRTNIRPGSVHQSIHSHLMSTAGSSEGTAFINIPRNNSGRQPVVSRFPTELPTSLAAAAAAELPCTVKLRIWPYNIEDPCAPLEGEHCRLTIPHAVLCSEMGAHFSPCGRYLAACVACVLPHLETDAGLQNQVHHDVTGAGTSPTRHPISAHQIIYELRIYSLEEATFGLVLASRAIRAAHCLTSIQFSPTSEHLLLAYGRRHSSLLKSVLIDGEITVPIYTILEVYRVSDMELVRVLPSAEDEVNVASFHPSVGGGIVYGTKEGKLRILQFDNSYGRQHITSSFLNENILEVPTQALEC